MSFLYFIGFRENKLKCLVLGEKDFGRGVSRAMEKKHKCYENKDFCSHDGTRATFYLNIALVKREREKKRSINPRPFIADLSSAY